MSEPLRDEILEAAAANGEGGVTMGAIVDALCERGHRPGRVEVALWELLAQRRLTPCGFICRTLRRPGDGGAITSRAYEFLLVPWSPEQDRQLDLHLDGPQGAP